jgi:hypothetical protein
MRPRPPVHSDNVRPWRSAAGFEGARSATETPVSCNAQFGRLRRSKLAATLSTSDWLWPSSASMLTQWPLTSTSRVFDSIPRRG